MSNEPIISTTLPAGEYYVGDPCYAFDDHGLWIALLESADFRNDPGVLEADVDGTCFVATGTAYGDGIYGDQHGNCYGVDAGLIGVVPVASADPNASLDQMVLHTFDAPFTVSYEDGAITIGDLVIPTADDDEDGDICEWCGCEFDDCECNDCDCEDEDE